MPHSAPDETPTAELALAALVGDSDERQEALRRTHRALESALRPLLRRDHLDAILGRAHEAIDIEAPEDPAARLRQLVGARLLDAVADALDSARAPSEAPRPDWMHHLPPTAAVSLEPIRSEATGRRRVRRDIDEDSLELDIVVEG